MPQDNLEVESFKDKLSTTGNKISDLSKKVAKSTSQAIDKAAESIQSTVIETKEKLANRKEEKMQSLREEISSEKEMDEVLPMVTLPEFENQRMGIVEEQQNNTIELVEHMKRLSLRIDRIENRFKKLNEIEIERRDDIARNQIQHTIPNGLRRSINFLGYTMVIIFISILMNSKLENNPNKILDLELLTWGWTLIFGIWGWIVSFTLQKQTPTFEIPTYVVATIVFSLGISGGLLHYISGDFQVVATVGGFLSSISFLMILKLGVLGPLNKQF